MKPSLSSIILLIAVIALQLLPGCAPSPERSRLEHIETIIDERPDSAMTLLDSIAPATLSDADRHYLDFLTIKARDKAYIRHTSDSLIRDVMDYYSSHRTKQMLPEALYYGGRVYSDLGDYPTAIRHFQDALDLLPPGTDRRKLRANLLSQTGRLLDRIRLHREAIPYISEVLVIERNAKDTANLIYDLQLLGGIYLNLNENEKAEQCFSEALKLSSNQPRHFAAKSKMLLAASKYRKGDTDSAVYLIQNILSEVKPIARNTALSYLALIYQAANIPDSAIYYATSLINSPDSTNKKIGYEILLSPEYQSILNPDSLMVYVSNYRQIIEHIYNENEVQSALIERSMSNYHVHDRQRQEAEQAELRMRTYVAYCIIIILVMVGVVLYLKNRNRRNLIRLHESLENIKRLSAALDVHKISGKTHVPVNLNKQNIRQQLRDELYSLSQKGKTAETDARILKSGVYDKIQERIDSKQILVEDDPLWIEMENIVSTVSPEFKANLLLLTGGKMTKHDLHIALLVKFGIAPLQMSILLGRSKGTIVSRRDSLCLKIFDEKLGTKTIDSIIRLL